MSGLGQLVVLTPTKQGISSGGDGGGGTVSRANVVEAELEVEGEVGGWGGGVVVVCGEVVGVV